MSDAHSNLMITDKIFDTYVEYATQALKEMRCLKYDDLKEIVKLLQGFREDIVKNQDPPKTLYEQIG